MPRIRTALFPNAQFNRAGAITPIPQSDITDNWDQGPLILLASLQCRCTVVSPAVLTVACFKDGVNVTARMELRHHTTAIDYASLFGFWIDPTPAGLHTYQLHGGVQGAGTFTLDALTGYLCILQLPMWTTRPSALVPY